MDSAYEAVCFFYILFKSWKLNFSTSRAHSIINVLWLKAQCHLCENPIPFMTTANLNSDKAHILLRLNFSSRFAFGQKSYGCSQNLSKSEFLSIDWSTRPFCRKQSNGYIRGLRKVTPNSDALLIPVVNLHLYGVRILFQNKYSSLTQCSWSFFCFFKNPRCMWGVRAEKEILILLNAISFRELYLHLKSQSHRNNSLSKERPRGWCQSKEGPHIVGIHQSTHVRGEWTSLDLLRQIKDWNAPKHRMRNWEKKRFWPFKILRAKSRNRAKPTG